MYNQNIKQRLPDEYFISKNDINKLIESADSFRDRLIIKLLYDSGCRVGELVSIRVEDLDFENNLISLRAEITKTKTARRPSVTPTLMNEIRLYLKEYGHLNKKKSPVFNSRQKKYKKNNLRGISTHEIRYLFKKYCKIAGLKYMNPHKLRHSHIKHNLIDGVPLNAVQYQVGHRNLTTTNIYSQVGHIETRKAYSRV